MVRSMAIGMAVTLLAGTGSAAAQDQAGAGTQGGGTAGQANNPLLGATAFNVQNHYIGDFTTPGEQDGLQTIFRFAQPFKIGDTDWLFRASLPIRSFPTPPAGDSFGLGDADAFAAFIIDTGIPSLTFGVGPQVTFPTATSDFLGSEKWSAGITNVASTCSRRNSRRDIF